eukprot:scaffold3014_cov172-Amphora_coffeaeformis.AAC.10
MSADGGIDAMRHEHVVTLRRTSLLIMLKSPTGSSEVPSTTCSSTLHRCTCRRKAPPCRLNKNIE